MAGNDGCAPVDGDSADELGVVEVVRALAFPITVAPNAPPAMLAPTRAPLMASFCKGFITCLSSWDGNA